MNGSASPVRSPTCAAVTASGKPCRNPPASPQPYCTLHAQILLEQLDASGGLAVAQQAQHPVPEGAEPSPVQVVATPTLMVRPAAPWTARAVANAAAVIAFLVVAGALVGYATAGFREEIRAARAEVTYLLDDSLPTGFLREDRRLSTQLVTIESRSLLAPIASRYGLDVDELGDDVSATVLDDSEVIRIEVHDTDGERAVAITSDILTAYGEQVAATVTAPDSDAAVAELAAVDGQLVDALLRLRDIDEIPDDPSALSRQIDLVDRRDAIDDLLDDDATGDAERRSLELEARSIDNELIEDLAGISVQLGIAPDAVTVAERDAMTRRVTDLLGERAELLAGGADPVEVAPTSVLTPPYLLHDPVAPRPMRSAIAGGLVGLVAGLLVVLVQRRRQQTER